MESRPASWKRARAVLSVRREEAGCFASGIFSENSKAKISSLNRQQERLLEGFRDPAQEAGGVCAVDQPVVVGQRHRQHKAWFELPVQPHRLHAEARKTKDGNLRIVHDRRESSAANSAEVGDGEGAAFHFSEREFLIFRFAG